MAQTTMPLLGKRFDDALQFASDCHRNQVRKGTRIPYISHLLMVAALVLEDGGDEESACAAVLHDVLEDTPTDEQELLDRFGPTVTQLVVACSDSRLATKGPWLERKRRYLDHLCEVDADALRISLADKLHNARSVLRDYQREGEALWQRFNPVARSAERQLWYYRSLTRRFAERQAGPMVWELNRVVAELEQLCRARAADRATGPDGHPCGDEPARG